VSSWALRPGTGRAPERSGCGSSRGIGSNLAPACLRGRCDWRSVLLKPGFCKKKEPDRSGSMVMRSRTPSPGRSEG